nr:acyl-CoA dehydrogenase family protein [Salipaludibacillus agaradhaerens]
MITKTTEKLLKRERQRTFYQLASRVSEPFKERAIKNDREACFPFENMAELKKAELTTLTVPAKWGGKEASLYELLIVQETIAKGDGPTALSLGWHNGLIMQLRQTRKWEEAMFEAICREAVDDHILINAAASEKATGSPARGGMPETTATKSAEGWRINGSKTYTSLAPALDYFIVTAAMKGEDRVGEFLIPAQTAGVEIEETWETLGMRSTRSDDLHLKNVLVNHQALVAVKDAGHGKSPQGWLLHIPACYLGIAQAARDEAVAFAKSYQPNSLSHPISEVPEVRRKVAEMDLELMSARHFMYHIAEVWDNMPEYRPGLGEELAAVKTICTNAAVKVVDLSMRIAGGYSLHKAHHFERYYRDVRAGLHNPPSDDLTTAALARRAFD